MAPESASTTKWSLEQLPHVSLVLQIQIWRIRNFAQATAETAFKVVKLREHQTVDENDQLAALITDAYATVAVAYRRASTVYTADEDMQQLGTAAVHLLTVATSYMAARSTKITPSDDTFD